MESDTSTSEFGRCTGIVLPSEYEIADEGELWKAAVHKITNLFLRGRFMTGFGNDIIESGLAYSLRFEKSGAHDREFLLLLNQRIDQFFQDVIKLSTETDNLDTMFHDGDPSLH